MSFLLAFVPELIGGLGATGLAEGGLLSGMGGMTSTIGNMSSILLGGLNPFQQTQTQSSGFSMTTIAIIGIGGVLVLTILIK